MNFFEQGMYRTFKDMTIRKKMVIMVLVVVNFVLFINAYYQINSSISETKQELALKISTTTHLAALGFSDVLWNYNTKGMEVIGEALFADREIGFVAVSNLKETLYEKLQTDSAYQDTFMTYATIEVFKEKRHIGQVKIGFTDYYRKVILRNKMIATFVGIVMASAMLLFLIKGVVNAVTKPIYLLEVGTEEIAKGNLSKRIVLETTDEIGRLAGKFNVMTESLETMIRERDVLCQSLLISEENLIKAKDWLEERVEERTLELNATNQELRAINEQLFDTLDQLQSTQAKLIESEKMAALGNLVIGVAHELNTPVGICLTSASYLEQLSKVFIKEYEDQGVKRHRLEEYLSQSTEATEMIMNNLDKAVKLINRFKQISIDELSDEKRRFNVLSYLEELIFSLSPNLNKEKQSIDLICDPNLELESFPGTFAKIITLLVSNALIHAYEPEEKGKMTLEVFVDEAFGTLIFSDDGKGMTAEVAEHVFDPFFTTKHGTYGCPGLGLFVAYNLVSQRLKGSIACNSVLGQGTQVVIKWSLEII